MSYGNGIKLTAGFDVGAKTPLDSKSVVPTIAERDAFVTDNLVYEGLEVYVKETRHKYRYDGASWIDLDAQSGSESGTGEGLTTEQANQLTTAYEHSQTPHVSADDIPTKTSDLTNDSGFITSIPSEYITETELETKGYLTEHQSLTDYAKKTDIPDVSDFLTEVPEGYVTDTKLSTELDKKVNKEVGKGLSTNDLTNELVIKINSSATEAFVTNAIANAQLGGGEEVDLSGYATIDALKLKADLTHTHDEYLTKVPDEYITETELTAKGYLTEHQDISNLALKSEIPDVSSFITSDDLPTVPTKVSDLTNDSNFITSIPEEYITETELNAKGYLTEHQDISNLQSKTDDSLTTTDKTVIGAINEVKLSIPTRTSELENNSNFITNDDLPTVPTKVSDLENDSNFVTNSKMLEAIANAQLGNGEDSDIDLSVYQPIEESTLTTTAKTIPTAINELKSGLDGIKVPINISELNNDSGYLTSHQDISNLQPKTDNSLATTDKTVIGAINELKTNMSNINTGAIGNTVLGKETVLYGSQINTTGTFTLTDDVNNYDFIIINHNMGGADGKQSVVLTKNEISICTDTTNRFLCTYGDGNASFCVFGYFNRDKVIITNCTTEVITSIIGYKFGQITVANTITNPSIGTSYSTEEQLTGGTWIDGKPVYRKTINCGALPNNDGKLVSHGINNIDTFININGVAICANDTIPIPYAHKETDGVVRILVSPTEIKIITWTDRTEYTKTYVTLEYTKTTD